MVRRLASGLVLIALVPGVLLPVDQPRPSLHPNLGDAEVGGFSLLVGASPFTVPLWLEHAGGYATRWDLDGGGMVDASAAGLLRVRFARPGVYYPSVTLSSPDRPTITMRQRIVVLGAGPAAALPGRFGVNQDLAWDPPEQLGPEITLMKAAGVQWLRLPLRWHWLEPERDHYRWDRVDGVVDRAASAGLQLLAVLGGTPAWSSGVAARDLPPGMYWDAYEPSDARDFAEYVYHVAEHFRGRVRAYELFNEPNSPTHWRPAPNAARFVELLCAGYFAAKYADPDSVVVAGGLNGNGLTRGRDDPKTRDFLKAIYRSQGAACFDVMAIHPFAHPTENGLAGLQAWVDEARRYMAALGDTRELWLTEVGWSSGAHQWGHPTITEAQQAAWVRTVYRDLKGPEKVFWYNFKEVRRHPSDPEFQWGWLRYDLVPKPAYWSFVEARQ